MISRHQAAEELLNRRKARSSFEHWCRLLGYEPAKHHLLIIQILQALTDNQPIGNYPELYKTLLKLKPDLDAAKPLHKVMLLMPPGTAKSTYTSKAFPAWYLGKKPAHCILSCSYAKDLVNSFGRAARNYVDEHANLLGYSLSRDTKAADEWETSTKGRYFCAGVNAGIAGHRADFGLIDDPIGSEADANSKSFRETLRGWYVNDFTPRLKPDAIQVLIANRRHEMDLCGMLLTGTDDDPKGIAGDKNEWLVVRLPFFCDSINDPLDRQVGESIWPGYFHAEFVEGIRNKPAQTKAGLYQQKPSPEDGEYFRREWLKGYEPQDLPPLKELRIYTGSDHAISKKDEANKSCFLSAGVDCNDEMWILPFVFWQRADSAEQVNGMFEIVRKYRPIVWRAEAGHISKSLLPFINKRKREDKVYFSVLEYSPVKDKQTRARSIQGRMSSGMVRFPKFAPWWADAEHDLLAFDCGKDDDFIDALAHLGNQIDQMSRPDKVEELIEQDLNPDPVLDYRWLKSQQSRTKTKELAAANG